MFVGKEQATFLFIGFTVGSFYGTLFDIDHACKEMAIQLGDNWEKLSSIWRQKQLEYSWLHNSMNEYDSFWKITKDSLEYAMNSLSINSVKIKNKLLDPS